MLTVLSPAKTLDYETAPITQAATLPRFMDQSALLVEDARGLDPDGIRALMGVSEQIIFPEIDYEKIDKLRGLAITITTSARNDDEGRALLRAFNFPLKG